MEQTFLQGGSTLVTSARVQIGGTMVPVSAIASVSFLVHPPNRKTPLVFAACLLLAGAFAAVSSGKNERAAGWVLFSLPVLAFAVTRPKRYTVSVLTAGGTQELTSTTDQASAQALATALHQAVAARG